MDSEMSGTSETLSPPRVLEILRRTGVRESMNSPGMALGLIGDFHTVERTDLHYVMKTESIECIR